MGKLDSILDLEVWTWDCLFPEGSVCTSKPVSGDLGSFGHSSSSPEQLGFLFKKRSIMSRRKKRSAFDQVSEFDRGRIVAYRDCGLSFRKSVVVLDETKQL
ncbi:hypothetical protein TNCV_1278531 [Trichonephila clavipes]|nr:hypothetical protein TNCV_1278531 [Trichonephila clavipes]